MNAVVDASVVVAAVTDSGPLGGWAEDQLAQNDLMAPHLLPVEVTNVLRRAESAGDLSPDNAALALMDALDLPIDLVAFEPFAPRVWQLRGSITAYDAWYVALAEATGAPLVTLDRRLATAPGPTCPMVIPPTGL